MLRRFGLGIVASGLACASNPTQDGATETNTSGGSAHESDASVASGSDTETPTSSDATDTSFKPVCGDGVISGDEICDDGNLSPEDGCDQCTPGLSIVWSRVIDGPAHGYDSANAVAVTAAGEVYAVGVQQDANAHTDIVVRKFATDGSSMWEQIVDGPGGHDDGANGVVVGDDGGPIVVGYVSVTPDGASTRAWARRYAADGAEIWTVSEDAPVAGKSRAWSAAIDADALYVVGTEPVGDKVDKATLRRLDRATGKETWQQGYGGGPLSASGNDILIAGTAVFVAGSQQPTDGSSVANLQRWTSDGALVSTWTWSDPAWDSAYGVSLAALSDGSITQAIQVFGDDGLGSYLVCFADDGSVRWSVQLDQAESSFLQGVAVDASDRTIVVGAAKHPLYDTTAYVSVYLADGGESLFEFMDGSEGHSGLLGVALQASEVAVVGSFQTMTGADQWIRKLTLP